MLWTTYELVVENTMDASKEKHIPVVEKLNPGLKLQLVVYYIQWMINTI